MATTKRVKITRAVQKLSNGQMDTFRVTMTASDAVGMPNEVFLYCRRPAAIGQTEPSDRFETVCSGVDIAAYPADDPEVGADPPYLRRASIDLRFDSQEMAERAIVEILSRLDRLKASLDRNEDLAALGPAWVGDAP